MDSKTRIFLSLSAIFLLHFNLSAAHTANCVPRVYTHMLHELLPPPSHAQGPPQQQQTASPPPAQTTSAPPPSDSQQPSQQQQKGSNPEQPPSQNISPPVGKPAADEGHPFPFMSPELISAIKDCCAKTDYADLCVSSLTSIPPLPGPINPTLVLKMGIKVSNRHANAGLTQATQLVATPSLPQFTKSNLQVCQDSYSSAVDNLRKAQDAIVANDKATVNTMLSAALTDVGTCSDTFMEMPGASPLTDYDQNVSQMVSNCLAISEQV